MKKKEEIKEEAREKTKIRTNTHYLAAPCTLFCYHHFYVCVCIVCILYRLGFRLQYIKYRMNTLHVQICVHWCRYFVLILCAAVVCTGPKVEWMRERESERCAALMFGVFSFSAQQPIIKQHEYRSMSPFLTAVHWHRHCCCCCSLLHTYRIPYAPLRFPDVCVYTVLSTFVYTAPTINTRSNAFQCRSNVDVLEFSLNEQQWKRNPNRLTLAIKSSVYFESLINVIQNLERNNFDVYKVWLAATMTAAAPAEMVVLAMTALNFYPE